MTNAFMAFLCATGSCGILRIENDEVKGFRRAYTLKVISFNLIPDLMPPPEEFGIVPACDRA